uniref:Uncharacterized protein n=1 Tax=Ditylenchus dipsaci TaxID=166011 RepID=A0A915DC01_9BILA
MPGEPVGMPQKSVGMPEECEGKTVEWLAMPAEWVVGPNHQDRDRTTVIPLNHQDGSTMASLELIIDALNFLSLKEKCSIVFLSKCLNTNLMPQVKLQRKQIFDKERNLFKLKLSLKCQLTSYRANQNQLKNQRKTLSRQYYENLTALQFLNVPAQQRQQQEAALNTTYSQQVGQLCQQIKAYDCKKAFVLPKFTIFKLGFTF